MRTGRGDQRRLLDVLIVERRLIGAFAGKDDQGDACLDGSRKGGHGLRQAGAAGHRGNTHFSGRVAVHSGHGTGAVFMPRIDSAHTEGREAGCPIHVAVAKQREQHLRSFRAKRQGKRFMGAEQGRELGIWGHRSICNEGEQSLARAIQRSPRGISSLQKTAIGPDSEYAKLDPADAGSMAPPAVAHTALGPCPCNVHAVSILSSRGGLVSRLKGGSRPAICMLQDGLRWRRPSKLKQRGAA